MPFDFDAIGTPFRMQPGLRRLAPGAARLTPTRRGDPVLITTSDHLARLVTGSERWERWVLPIMNHPQIDAHPARHQAHRWPADVDAEQLTAPAYLRTERQTFIPLTAHRQAVFTIHVGSQPLAQAITEPAQAQRLHDALHSMSAAVLAYRDLTDARDRLPAWLRSRSNGSTRRAE